MAACKNNKLVCGVGVNDADYAVVLWEPTEERYPSGERKRRQVWICPYYRKWCSMLERCYSEEYHKRNPTYKDCCVYEEWLTFSNFKQWMETQDWEGKALDKDILVRGNKVYSPDTCVFVQGNINNFLIEGGRDRGNHLLGCYLHKATGKFMTQIGGLFKKNQIYLGLYNTEQEAHLAWKRKKHEFACQLAESEYVTDERVKHALENRYKNFDILEDHIK